MISSLLVNSLTDEENKESIVVVNDKIKLGKNLNNVYVLPTHKNIAIRLFYRLLIEFIFVPYLGVRHKAHELLAFGNFNFIPFPYEKKILIHHPYLVDDVALAKLKGLNKQAERLKRLCFIFQCMFFRKNKYFAQTKSFKLEIEQKYQLQNKVFLLPNPLTNNLYFPTEKDVSSLIDIRCSEKSTFKITYVSRYYPHKNHTFLFELSDEIEKINLPIQIFITVDETSLPKKLLDRLQASNVVTNIGEVAQSELMDLYTTSHLCIFPSSTETFGNGLIEAAKFALPVIAFDRTYVKDVLGNNVDIINSVNTCLSSISRFYNNENFYRTCSREIFVYSNQFLDVESWKKELFINR